MLHPKKHLIYDMKFTKKTGKGRADVEMLMSIKKEFSDKIFSGGKTIEVRRTIPKEITYPIKSYLYETKGGQGEGKVIGYF